MRRLTQRRPPRGASPCAARPVPGAPSGTIRRVSAALLAFLLACGLVVGNATPAQADLARLGAYAMDYVLHDDGSADISLDFTAEFSATDNHGVVVNIPVQVATSDPKVDRAYPLSNVAVSSTTGAPADFSVSTTSGVAAVKIGSRQTTIDGTHRYRVTYTQQGVINKANGQEEFYWNVADGWSVAIANAEATVTAPATPSALTCYSGARGTKTRCTNQSVDPGTASAPGRAVFSQTRVAANHAFTIVAAYPAGTFREAPVLTADPAMRIHGYNTSTVLAWIIPGMAILLLAAVVIGLSCRPRTPGPSLSDVVAQLDASATPSLELPPIWPYLIGLLRAGTISDEDLPAMLVSLRDRGLLRLAPQIGPQRANPSGPMVPTGAWVLTSLVPLDSPALTTAERALFAGLFGRSTEIVLSAEPSQPLIKGWKAACKALRREPSVVSWLELSPAHRERVFMAAVGYGGAAIVAVMAISWIGLWPIAWPVPVVLMAGAAIIYALRHRFKNRYQPAGVDLSAHVAALRAGIIGVCEGAIPLPASLRPYAPYAIALGYGQTWADLAESRDGGLSSLGAAGRPTDHSFRMNDTPWWLFVGSAQSTIAAAASPPSGSSGDSGFSGSGSSGGGGGGTGGHGW